MSETTAAGLGWTRRAAGSSVLVYFFLSGALWLGCLLAWQVRQPEVVVALLGLGAFVPLLWLAVRLQTHPVWALQVRERRTRVVDVLREALRDRAPTVIGPAEAGHGGLFQGCEPLLRLEHPGCLVGVRQDPSETATTLLLLPESKDRAALSRLRATIEARVRPPG